MIDLHESVGKADFRAVDDAIAHGLYEDEVVMVYGVEEEPLDRCLENESLACTLHLELRPEGW